MPHILSHWCRKLIRLCFLICLSQIWGQFLQSHGHMVMAAAQDVVKDADSRRLFSFSRPIVMLSWLPWHGGREDACGHSAVKETRAESCHPDTADRFPPDSAQVDHDRSHHLHLACALSVLSLFSVLRKGSRGTAPQGRPEKRREKFQQGVSVNTHFDLTPVLSDPKFRKTRNCVHLCHAIVVPAH